MLGAIEEIADEYGYEAQSRQLIEEMAELTQAINKDWRVYQKFNKTKDNSLHPKLDEAHNHLVEELADVFIVWHQVAYLIGSFHAENHELEDAIGQKVIRQKERIRESKEKAESKANTEMARIKTSSELLEANYDELTPEEQKRCDRIKRIPPAIKEMFLNIEREKREMILKLENQRDAIMDYLEGFTDNASEVKKGGDFK